MIIMIIIIINIIINAGYIKDDVDNNKEDYTGKGAIVTEKEF